MSIASWLQEQAKNHSNPVEIRLGCKEALYEIELLQQKVNRLALYENLAKEYGLQVFEDMANLSEQLTTCQAREANLKEAIMKILIYQNCSTLGKFSETNTNQNCVCIGFDGFKKLLNQQG